MRLDNFVAPLALAGASCVQGTQLVFSKILHIAVATTAILFLLQTTYASVNSGSDRSSDNNSMAFSNYDCSAGGRIRRNRFAEKAVEQGISEALKVLQNCEACKEFFGSADPIATLNHLVKIHAILVSDKVPLNLKPIGPEGLWRIGDLVPLKKSVIAMTVELFPGRTKGRFLRPCIYANPSGFLVADVSFEGSGIKDLTLAQARAVVILHELAHIADVIPTDGTTKKGTKRSLENTLCVLRNCIPCANRSSRCLNNPTLGSFQSDDVLLKLTSPESMIVSAGNRSQKRLTRRLGSLTTKTFRNGRPHHSAFH